MCNGQFNININSLGCELIYQSISFAFYITHYISLLQIKEKSPLASSSVQHTSSEQARGQFTSRPQ